MKLTYGEKCFLQALGFLALGMLIGFVAFCGKG